MSVREIGEKNPRMHKNLAKWLPHRICKESVAITLSTTSDVAIGDLAIGDLVIECLGVRAISSLDFRVAIIVVKMKRKMVATNRFSNVDSSIAILVAILHRMVFASFSRSSTRTRNSVVLVLVEDLREFSKRIRNLFFLSWVQLDDPLRCTPT